MFWVDSLYKFVVVGLAEMLDLVENVSKIAKITYYCWLLLAGDELCPEKIYVSAENMCQNCLENVLVLEKL